VNTSPGAPPAPHPQKSDKEKELLKQAKAFLKAQLKEGGGGGGAGSGAMAPPPPRWM
jgi:hypothetical protein